MTLIDRYVADVARRLPRSQRADIAQELSSSLLDARESRFGRAASEEDEVALLRELGPPDRVAASYRSSGQWLIGPEWFQTFSLAVRIHLISLAATLVIGIGLLGLTAGDAASVVGALAGLAGGVLHYGLLAFGAIVLAFYLLERGGVRLRAAGGEWDPRALPAPQDRDLVGRGEALTAIVGATVGLVLIHQLSGIDARFLAGVRPALPPGAAASVQGLLLLLSAVVRDSLWWITLGAVASIALYWLLLRQGRWRWYTRGARLAIDAVSVYVTYRVAQSVIGEQAALLQAGLDPELVALILQVAAAAPYLVAALVVLGVIARLSGPGPARSL